jgi:hypothetical protein
LKLEEGAHDGLQAGISHQLRSKESWILLAMMKTSWLMVKDEIWLDTFARRNMVCIWSLSVSARLSSWQSSCHWFWSYHQLSFSILESHVPLYRLTLIVSTSLHNLQPPSMISSSLCSLPSCSFLPHQDVQTLDPRSPVLSRPCPVLSLAFLVPSLLAIPSIMYILSSPSLPVHCLT